MHDVPIAQLLFPADRPVRRGSNGQPPETGKTSIPDRRKISARRDVFQFVSSVRLTISTKCPENPCGSLGFKVLFDTC